MSKRSFFPCNCHLFRKKAVPLRPNNMPNRLDMTTTSNAMNALKKAIAHKKEAKQKFERWLQEKGIEGEVVAL